MRLRSKIAVLLTFIVGIFLGVYGGAAYQAVSAACSL